MLKTAHAQNSNSMIKSIVGAAWLLSASCFLSTTGSAQAPTASPQTSSASPQIKWEVVAGYNDANLTALEKAPPTGTNYSSINSFHAGAAAAIPFGKNWMLDPGLLYYGNGARIYSAFNSPGGSYLTAATLTAYYLRLPVNLLYKIKLGGTWSIFLGGGFYVSRGLWGTEKGSSSFNEGPMGGWQTETFDHHLSFTKTTTAGHSGIPGTAFEPWDFGYTVSAGVEWKQFRLSPDISNGLVKAYEGSAYNVKNHVFSISLRYNLGAIL
jgi:opacity protein-like surface antigen